MSILSSLYHSEIHDKPNDVHNVPDTAHSGGSFGGKGNEGSDSGPARNENSGSGSGAARNAQGNFGFGLGGARQTSNAGSWMGVSFTDESAIDAQLADAHAVALSDAFDHSDHVPRRTQKSTDGSAVLPRHAERRMEALKEGNLRPPLYYTGQEQTPCASGVWESAHTVASKLESKEEFPQG